MLLKRLVFRYLLRNSGTLLKLSAMAFVGMGFFLLVVAVNQGSFGMDDRDELIGRRVDENNNRMSQPNDDREKGLVGDILTDDRPVDDGDADVDGLAKMEKRVKQLEKKLDRHLRKYPPVQFRNYQERKRILITGGAGFVGSHLVDRLMADGHEVTVIDNFFTGRRRNVQHWVGHSNFQLINHDVVEPIYLEVDEIYHLASPASPPHYMYNPVKTIKTNTIGTINMLGLAKRVNARLLFASTSEVYGDPVEHPQTETYWGNVNPVGPRACYDEAKRVAETMCYSYKKQSGVQVRVARIFNTYGPRMHMNDGRVVSNFILQALQNQNITIYGGGNQTRSFQYVSDLVTGLILLMNSNYSKPVNIGNPDERSIFEFAERIRDLVAGSTSRIVPGPSVRDDPRRRRPDISVARRQLGWSPSVPLDDGLRRTIEYFRRELGELSLTADSAGFVPVVPEPISHKGH